MVMVVWPVAPVLSVADTVTVRPGGLAAVNRPLLAMVSPAAPVMAQVTGCPLALSERVAVSCTVLPGSTFGSVGVTVSVALGALRIWKAGKVWVASGTSKDA